MALISPLIGICFNSSEFRKLVLKPNEDAFLSVGKTSYREE